MKHIRGTRYLSACRQTVSDCGCTPATASNTATAPSSTRSERSTSAVKSTCPGVSMMLICMSFQEAVVAADVIVMPRSCSCSIQSIVALLDGSAPQVGSFVELVGELVGHALFRAAARVRENPANREAGTAVLRH